MLLRCGVRNPFRLDIACAEHEGHEAIDPVHRDASGRSMWVVNLSGGRATNMPQRRGILSAVWNLIRRMTMKKLSNYKLPVTRPINDNDLKNVNGGEVEGIITLPIKK